MSDEAPNLTSYSDDETTLEGKVFRVDGVLTRSMGDLERNCHRLIKHVGVDNNIDKNISDVVNIESFSLFKQKKNQEESKSKLNNIKNIVLPLRDNIEDNVRNQLENKKDVVHYRSNIHGGGSPRCSPIRRLVTGKRREKMLGKIYFSLHCRLNEYNEKVEMELEDLYSGMDYLQRDAKYRKIVLDSIKQEALRVCVDNRLFGGDLLSILNTNQSNFTPETIRSLESNIMPSELEWKAGKSGEHPRYFVEKLMEQHCTVVFCDSRCVLCLKLLSLFTSYNIKHIVLRLDKMGDYGQKVRDVLVNEFSDRFPPNVYLHGMHMKFLKISASVIEECKDPAETIIGLLPDVYDLVVIGSMLAGVVAAIEGRGLGLKVCLIEGPNNKDLEPLMLLGRQALNESDVPMKYLSYISSLQKGAVRRPVKYTERAMKRRLLVWNTIIKSVRSLVSKINQENKKALLECGAGYFRCSLKFKDPHTIELTNSELEKYVLRSSYFLLSTFLRYVIPNIPGKDYCITPDQIIYMPHSPGNTLIYGASGEALEYATLLGGMGFPVTLMAPVDIMAEYDGDVVKKIIDDLKKYSINIIHNCVLDSIVFLGSKQDLISDVSQKRFPRKCTNRRKLIKKEQSAFCCQYGSIRKTLTNKEPFQKTLSMYGTKGNKVENITKTHTHFKEHKTSLSEDCVRQSNRQKKAHSCKIKSAKVEKVRDIKIFPLVTSMLKSERNKTMGNYLAYTRRTFAEVTRQTRQGSFYKINKKGISFRTPILKAQYHKFLSLYKQFEMNYMCNQKIKREDGSVSKESCSSKKPEIIFDESEIRTNDGILPEKYQQLGPESSENGATKLNDAKLRQRKKINKRCKSKCYLNRNRQLEELSPSCSERVCFTLLHDTVAVQDTNLFRVPFKLQGKLKEKTTKTIGPVESYSHSSGKLTVFNESIMKAVKLRQRHYVPKNEVLRNLSLNLFPGHPVYWVTGKFKDPSSGLFSGYFNTVLIVSARKVLSEDVNLDSISVSSCFSNGKIYTTGTGQTSISNIYSLGKCVYGWPFGHEDTIIASQHLVRRIFTDFKELPESRFLVHNLQTFPNEYAYIGMTEKEARIKFDTVITYLGSFNVFDSQLDSNDAVPSLLKLICYKTPSNREMLVGFHLYTEGAYLILKGYSFPMRYGGYIEDIENYVAQYPAKRKMVTYVSLGRKVYEKGETFYLKDNSASATEVKKPWTSIGFND